MSPSTFSGGTPQLSRRSAAAAPELVMIKSATPLMNSTILPGPPPFTSKRWKSPFFVSAVCSKPIAMVMNFADSRIERTDTVMPCTPRIAWSCGMSPVPRGLRGSLTCANAVRSSGAKVIGLGSSAPPSWSTRSGMDKDAGAGTALFR